MAAEDGTPSIDSELQETLKLPFEQFIEQIKSQHEQVYRFISFLHLQVLRLDPDSPFQEEGLNEKFIKYYGTYFYFKYYLDALEVRRCCIYTNTRFQEWNTTQKVVRQNIWYKSPSRNSKLVWLCTKYLKLVYCIVKSGTMGIYLIFVYLA